ncbi:DUF115 domain-containing protein [bacterium]|nr:DUF115 domain-containing protein [bacterium]
MANRLARLPRPDPAVRAFSARSGAIVVSAGDRPLVSRYDPEKEAADELARAFACAGGPTKATVAFGFAGAHLALAALGAGCRKVYVFEPHAGALALTLGLVDLAEPLSAGRLKIAHEIDHLYFQVAFRTRMTPDLAVAVAPGYRKPFADLIPVFYARVATLLRNAELETQTLAMKSRTWLTHAFANLPRFLSVGHVGRLAGKFAGVPVVIVAAGPSLDRNIDALARMRDRVVVIAVGTALKKLAATDIVPDIAVALESNDIRTQFEGIDALPRVFGALDLNSFPPLWDLPFAGLFGFAGGAADNAWFLDRLDRASARIPTGGSVATAAFSIADVMGGNPIVLIGQDLAYGESGQSHALGADEASRFDLASGAPQGGEADLAREGYFRVPGWRGGEVLTKTNLRNYLLWFEQSVPAVTAGGRRAINATEGGARIGGFEQVPLTDVLGALAPLAFDPRERLAACASPEPADATELVRDLERAEKKARRLRLLADELCVELKDVLDRLARDPDAAADRVARALRRAEQTDVEATPILTELDPVIAPFCQSAVFVAETAYDYEGLDDAGQARMNLRQTWTLYNGLKMGANEFLEHAAKLRARLR